MSTGSGYMNNNSEYPLIKKFGGLDKVNGYNQKNVDSTTKLIVNVWVFSLLLSPLILIIAWQIEFLLYALIFISAFFIISNEKLANLSKFPRLILGQIFILSIISIKYTSDMPTFVNIGSILFGSISLGLMMMMWPLNKETFSFVFSRVRSASFVILLVGIVFGPIFSSLIGTTNPISDVMNGDRLRIFSLKTGHSIAIECSVILFFSTSSGIFRESFIKVIFILLLSSAVMVLTKSSLSFVCLAGLAYVFFSETLISNSVVKNIMHVFIAVFAFTALITDGSDIIMSSRSIQYGEGAAKIYKRSDITAGRSDLNKILIESANKNPFLGGGVKDKAVDVGVFNHGKTESRTESGIRLAAKFGWIYFSYILLICISPISVLIKKDKHIRIVGLSIVVYCISTISINNLFEISQMWSTICMLPLVIFTSSCGFSRRFK